MSEISPSASASRTQTHKGSAVDFRLDPASGVPFYRQIIQTVEYHVGAGILRPGDQLPTIRSLAIALKINPNTIAKAYTELEIRGLVVTQVGSGTYVSDRKADELNEQERIKKKLEELCWELLRKASALGAGRKELLTMLRDLPEE